MKSGKFIELGNYKNVKIGYGTVDFRNLKTVYLKLNSWLLPLNDETEYDSIVLLSRRKIKNLIYELNNSTFKRESIVDLDIKINGIKSSKKSFMNLEITLFVNQSFDIKDNDYKFLIKDIIKHIIDNCLDNKILFNFNSSKN